MTARSAPDQDQTPPPPERPSPPEPPPEPADRLLAEAVRASERDGAALVHEPAADAEARAGGGDFESRIVRRARALSGAPDLKRALRSVQHVIGWTIFILVLLAVVAGAAAVRAALGAPDSEPVNFFLVFTGLLGLQTLLLALWLVLMIGSSRSSPVSPLGGAALAMGRWIATRGRHDVQHLAAVKATSLVFARGAVGRWTLSAISHGLWLSFNVGCVGLLIVLLTTKQYTFNWETTILSAPAYERITNAIAKAPAAAGFTVPTAAQIAATEKGVSIVDPTAARAWSGLLVGSLLVYGFGPRLLLLGLSLSARRRALARLRLDTTAPGFRRLRPQLLPDAEAQGVVDIGHAASPAAPPAAAEDDPEAGGRPVLFGLEIDPPAGPWPPALHAVRWVDLGFVDERDDRRRVRNELEALPTAPRMVVVVCAMTTTPDRGLGAFLEEVGRAARGPVALLLTGGHDLRERASADRVAQRSADWMSLADDAGITEERVLEIDLDHLTDASRQGLAKLLGAGDGSVAAGGSGPAGRRLEAAFDMIAQAYADGKVSPEPKIQAELHQRIARLYTNEAGGLRERLGWPGDPGGDLGRSMKDGAKRLVDRLPGSVRESPKWLAAGATAGAVGCIAIGTLVTPIAFAAIPAWSLSGAGLAGLLKFALGGDDAPGDAEDEPKADTADALRAIALFTLLLELQGRGEAEISRVLETTLTDKLADAAGDVTGRASCARWLDEVRHAFDLALAAETGR